MARLEPTRLAILREHHVLTTLLAEAAPSAWRLATRCAGWTVRDLAAHLAGVTDAQAMALERTVRGSTEQPGPHRPDLVTLPAGALLARLRAAGERLRAALAGLRPEHLELPCPLPVAVLPLGMALQIVLVEHGLHANDLAWALGDERPLGRDVVAAAGVAITGALPMLARRRGVPAAEGTSYRLRGHQVEFAFLASGGGWGSLEPEVPATATVAGNDSAIVLFALGRIPLAHPSLRVEGDPAVAAEFKRHFPGP